MFIDYGENSSKIGMVVGDYGIELPIEIEIEGTNIEGNDNLVMKIFKDVNEEPLIEKTFSDVVDNTLKFKLTKDESDKLVEGYYYYTIDWFRTGSFLGNIIKEEEFIVVGKAGNKNESKN